MARRRKNPAMSTWFLIGGGILAVWAWKSWSAPSVEVLGQGSGDVPTPAGTSSGLVPTPSPAPSGVATLGGGTGTHTLGTGIVTLPSVKMTRPTATLSTADRKARVKTLSEITRTGGRSLIGL